VHRAGKFEPDERFDAVAFGEAVEAAAPMLADALDQVQGDAGVERAVPRAGGDSDAGREVGVHGVEARVAMNPGLRLTSHMPRLGDEDSYVKTGACLSSFSMDGKASENPKAICLISTFRPFLRPCSSRM
jgi:hypothetical protein